MVVDAQMQLYVRISRVMMGHSHIEPTAWLGQISRPSAQLDHAVASKRTHFSFRYTKTPGRICTLNAAAMRWVTRRHRKPRCYCGCLAASASDVRDDGSAYHELSPSARSWCNVPTALRPTCD